MMWRVKRLADPDGILAPGVVLNRDPGVHLRNLKSTPEIEEVATKCIECGFCEPVCPARNVTTTPRQRIVLRREMARQPAGSPVRAALLEQYEYDAIQTCAADGSCSLACPVGIDTGKLVKELRAREHSRASRARRPAARRALRRGRAGRARGAARARALDRSAATAPLRALTGRARRAVGDELIPAWTEAMPAAGAGAACRAPRAGAAAVYLPACINRIFGNPREDARRSRRCPRRWSRVSARAGLPLWIPDDVAGHCCGDAVELEGLPRAATSTMARAIAGGARALDATAAGCRS